MAYRRCVSLRASLFARRSSPSFGYVSSENDLHKPEEFRSNIREYLTTSLAGSKVKNGSWRYCGSVFREGSVLAGAGLCMNRYMSTSTRDIATVLSDAPTEAVASQVPAIGEVAIAAADSSVAVAALQYLIDGVHTYTGLNWWASIAFTTLLFRGASVPLLMHEYKILAMIIPRLLEALQKVRAADPSAHLVIMSKFSENMDGFVMATFVHLFVDIDFYLAITNMAEKVPSFENGGAFWFTDLTTPDAMFILPILTALTYCCRPKIKFVEVSAESYKRAPVIRYKVGRVLFIAAALSAMNFPQAVYCSWITSNVFMCCFHYYLKHARVMRAWGCPIKLSGRARKP